MLSVAQSPFKDKNYNSQWYWKLEITQKSTRLNSVRKYNILKEKSNAETTKCKAIGWTGVMKKITEEM